MEYNKCPFTCIVLPNGIHFDSENNKNYLIFSVCLNINKYYFTDNPVDNNIKYNDFFELLKKLKEFFENTITFNIKYQENLFSCQGFSSEYPLKYFHNELPYNGTDFVSLRNLLWDKLFFLNTNSTAAELKINQESNIALSNLDLKIDPLLSENDKKILFKYNVFSDHIDNETRPSDDLKDLEIKKTLKKINEYGSISNKIADKQKIDFIRSNSSDETLKNLKNLGNNRNEAKDNDLNSLLQIKKEAIKNYLAGTKIDIDEIFHSFNAISNEPVLMRIMGLIKDFKIELPPELSILTNGEFTIDAPILNQSFLSIPTEITILSKFNKLAYLVKKSKNYEKYFENSILIPYSDNLVTYDQVNKVTQLYNISEKIMIGEKVNENESLEILTRGILYTHKDLHKIINPVSLIGDDGKLLSSLTDEFITRGYRVAVQITENHNSQIFSLTDRGLILEWENEEIYKCGNIPGCIHFDSPAMYMQDGLIKAASSDVLFEYTGELLNLKSAFSKASLTENSGPGLNNDGGLFKSKARFEKYISFFHFPFVETQDKSELNFKYSIPSAFKKNYVPRLRFHNEYAFAVYQDYLNGWGIPLNIQENSIQLSLIEILNKEAENNSGKRNLLSDKIRFRPLENKKNVILFHKKQVNEELEKSILEKPSLEHLIVRSQNGNDKNAIVDERHILPPKIELETAFWYGLLSEPYMNAVESYNIKRKSNCSFTDRDDYEKYIDEKNEKGEFKGNKCLEGCTKYCGGTQMETYYPSNYINPNFLTDPSIKGFKIELYWDKEFKRKVETNKVKESIFSGKAGIKPNSYLLSINGSLDETSVFNNEKLDTLTVFLKKGMVVYALIENILDDEKWYGKKNLVQGWWHDQLETRKNNSEILEYYEKSIKSPNETDLSKYNRFISERNVPKKLIFTHAVKEPLFIPRIVYFVSTPNEITTKYIDNWLKNSTKYKNSYNITKNVVGNRPGRTTHDQYLGSSEGKIEFTSRFERLDAIKVKEFLNDVTPTGSLELWVRKEEYIDNPDQIVIENSEYSHNPKEPVLSFDSIANTFTLEHKIEFSNAILTQMKNSKNISVRSDISDAFRSQITTIGLQYDFKTTKFEEREYFLKNVSKFEGFFTDKNLNDNEEFSLPKLSNVLNDSELRFKVMVLNNKPPNKPDVAYSITTIQEIRKKSEDYKYDIDSYQKGNTVTIYLRRGRLSSGKDERVGIIVNDTESIYNEYYAKNDLFSVAGRDIVSDRYANKTKDLKRENIIIPENNEYKAGYDKELGIYHYLPIFDIQKQLWKFEVELNIKTEDGKNLHNPFVNFSIIHFQPFSINYNENKPLDINKDCRISDVENSIWCYLLPERKLSVNFQPPEMLGNYGFLDMVLSYDFESLHHFNNGDDSWIVRTNFILTIQGSDDGVIWHNLLSGIKHKNTVTHDKVDDKTLLFHHALLTKEIINQQKKSVDIHKLMFKKQVDPIRNSQSFSNVRARIIEVEWFSNETWGQILVRNNELLKTDLVDNEEMRIRYVDLFY